MFLALAECPLTLHFQHRLYTEPGCRDYPDLREPFNRAVNRATFAAWAEYTAYPGPLRQARSLHAHLLELWLIRLPYPDLSGLNLIEIARSINRPLKHYWKSTF